ncbi:MAG TPA: succinylglutamate desuccinylase/aspartoacylase family protein, partial [Thermoanaerobaculia bacterium]|nr:succinylglutamate desuccinylase/aspartoacylase family protein [Thermoanaerobaculia bacterium]
RRLERPFIEVGKAGVLNVLRWLRMLEGDPLLPPVQLTISRTHWVRARAGGILDLRVELGQPVRRGQTLSVNTNPFGRERRQLKAPHGGVVLGLTQLPLVHPGDAVCHLARLGSRELEAWTAHWQAGGRLV